MTVLRVALTGGIATGKSYVLNRLADQSVPTVDTDQLARKVVRPGEPAHSAIRDRFGAAMFQPDGTLDRARLGDRIFGNDGDRAALEAIVHPHIRLALDRWFDGLQADQRLCGVAAIPLLYETGRAADFHRVIVSACAPDRQLERLMARDGLSAEAARQRVATQLPSAEKEAQADFVIRTDGSFENTDAQVDAVCQQLRAVRID